MTPDPILEELWRVKDDLTRETGYDIDSIFEELRTAESQQPGRLIHTEQELQRYAEEQANDRNAASALALKEEPPSAAPQNRSE